MWGRKLTLMTLLGSGVLLGGMLAVRLVEADVLTVRLGRISARAGQMIRVPVVNRAAVPRRVAEVQTGCGCTTLQTPRGVIGPGETFEIQGVVDGEGRSGPFSVSATVVWDDGERQRLRLFGDAVVEAPARVDLGRMVHGRAHHHALLIRSELGETVTLRSWRVVAGQELGAATSVGLALSSARQQGRDLALDIVVWAGDDWAVGRRRWVMARETDGTAEGRHEIEFIAQLAGHVVAEPAFVSLGAATLDDLAGREWSIVLSSPVGRRFRVSEVGADALPGDLIVRQSPAWGEWALEHKVVLVWSDESSERSDPWPDRHPM